jgi:hypothetical protein
MMVWYLGYVELFLFFFFFLSSPWVMCMPFKNIKCVLLVCIYINFSHIFLLLFVLLFMHLKVDFVF